MKRRAGKYLKRESTRLVRILLRKGAGFKK